MHPDGTSEVQRKVIKFLNLLKKKKSWSLNVYSCEVTGFIGPKFDGKYLVEGFWASLILKLGIVNLSCKGLEQQLLVVEQEELLYHRVPCHVCVHVS